MPVVMVATVLFLRGVARVDPPTDRRSFDVIVCSTVFLLAVVQSFALAWNLGYRIPFAVLPLVVAVWSVFVVGYALITDGRGR
jgi:hypothetical protein